MTNGEYLIQNHIPFNTISAEKAKGGMMWNIYIPLSGEKVGQINADVAFTDIVTGQSTESSYRAIFRWLDAEHKEPILTEKEHDYLAAVIKPWKDQIVNITKQENLRFGEEWIRFLLCNDSLAELPSFSKGRMYKGMLSNKKYSLADLDL